MVKLQSSISDKMSILVRAGERFEYENQQQIAKKKREELDEEEKSTVLFNRPNGGHQLK